MAIPRRPALHRLQPVAADHVAASRLFVSDPGRWLPEPGRRRGVDQWTVALTAGRVHRRISCGVGSVWQLGDDVWRTITWQAVPQDDEPLPAELALPTLRGELGLVAGDGGPVLVLDGTYRPPAGVFGAVADKVLLHRIADATAGAFLAAVAHRLARPSAPSAPAARALSESRPREG